MINVFKRDGETWAVWTDCSDQKESGRCLGVGDTKAEALGEARKDLLVELETVDRLIRKTQEQTNIKNMKIKHTPGPWMVSGCCAGNRPLIQTQAESFSPIIAEVCDDGGRLPSQINARLIAAAPELLAALRESVAGETDWQHEAKAAIAKAEGGKE